MDDIPGLRIFVLHLGRADWPVRGAVLESLSDEDLLLLVRSVVRCWRVLAFDRGEAAIVPIPLANAMKILARRGARRKAIAAAKLLIALFEHIDSISRRTALSRIEECCDVLGPACRPIVRSLTLNPYRTAREFGFRLASRHRLSGFEVTLRSEWSKPARWVAAYSVELLGPMELQGLAWEIWQLSNARIRVRLLRRGVRVPLEWVDAFHVDAPAHWLVLRCELGTPPGQNEALAVLANATSQPQLIEMCGALARVGWIEFLFKAEEANAERWAQLSRFAQGADDYSAPKLPNADNLSLWEDP